MGMFKLSMFIIDINYVINSKEQIVKLLDPSSAIYITNQKVLIIWDTWRMSHQMKCRDKYIPLFNSTGNCTQKNQVY